MSLGAAEIGILLGIAFVAGIFAGARFVAGGAKDTLKAAESAAAIAQGYCDQGQSFYARAQSLEREVAKMNSACDLLTKANNSAAEKLDAMDRTQGAMLSALINVGIIGSVGGKTAGPRESDFAG